MEKDEFSNTSSEADLSEIDGEGDAQDEYINNVNDLTQLQEDIIYAIETLNKAFFIDLGG